MCSRLAALRVKHNSQSATPPPPTKHTSNGSEIAIDIYHHPPQPAYRAVALHSVCERNIYIYMLCKIANTRLAEFLLTD